jgi:hypothetical protein
MHACMYSLNVAVYPKRYNKLCTCGEDGVITAE